MIEKYEKRVHTEHVVLDIGQDIGALIVYTREDLRGKQIDVSLKENATAKRVHTDVLERMLGGRPVFAAVFAALPAGEYVTWSDPAETFTIVGGGIAELNWRDVDIYVPPVSSTDREGRGSAQCISSSSALASILPSRYQGGEASEFCADGYCPYAVYRKRASRLE